MFGVVQQVVTGIGVQKNHQPAPIERQPRQDDTDQFGTEGQLAAPVRVRANRAFGPELIGVVLPWLALYRHGLVVFMHPDTGNDLLDHTDHAIWMGAIRPLDLSVF